MFSSWFASEPEAKTRFLQHQELKAVQGIIEKIRAKSAAFAKVGEQNASSIEFTKFKIFNALLIRMDRSLAEFNKSEKNPETVIERDATIDLLKSLLDHAYDVSVNHSALLNVRRDKNKEIAGGMADAGAFLGLFAAGLMMPLPTLITIGGAYFVHKKVSKPVKGALGLDHPEVTDSGQLIIDLLRGLRMAHQNLCLDRSLEMEKQLAEEEPKNPLICILSGGIMEDPVLCTLDGRTYEREQITKWLSEKKTSPVNRKEMEKWQTVDDVLVPNRAIKDLIDEYWKEEQARGQSNVSTSPAGP